MGSIAIPDSVTSIGEDVFYNCRSLTSVTIPDSVTSIGGAAFSFCNSLKEITLSLVSTRTDTYQYPFGYFFDSNYTGSHNTTQYHYDLTNNKRYYKTYYIPTSLKSVTITGKNIPDAVFNNCSNLTSVTISDSVTSIGNEAFYDCSNLTSVTISDSVTSIGDEAFYYCKNLNTVYYKGTAEDWENIAIGSLNDSLTTATRYYYSETQPTTSGNYWHYVDGIATPWISTEE